MSELFKCLYCDNVKSNEEISLEHAVPQFMGGTYAPERFRLHNVCKKCNNELGLFVDASYAKSWLITMGLAEAARKHLTKADDPGLPLRCIGEVEINNLVKPANTLAEYWIGPSGESIVWIRYNDERMYNYMGGNPSFRKKKNSVIYYFPVSESEEKHLIGLNSFKEAIGKNKKIRKILCAEILGENEEIVSPKKIGFDEPEVDDLTNWKAIKEAIDSGAFLKGRFAIKIDFDHRFICKLALGVGYSIFGNQMHDEINHLQRGIWPKKDESKPKINGNSTLALSKNETIAKWTGYPGAIAICILKTNNQWQLCVSIDESLPFTITIGDGKMKSEFINEDEGYVLLLFPYLKESIEVSLAELLAHKINAFKNSNLKKIDDIRNKAEDFGYKLYIPQ